VPLSVTAFVSAAPHLQLDIQPPCPV
jgi:hypothetical protein